MRRLLSSDQERHVRLLDEINDGNVRGAEKQLDAGVDVDGLNPEIRPIHVAARCGHTKVIEMLARRGANLEAAVSRAAPDGYGGEAVPKGARALHAAVMSKEPGAVQALLDAGADPNPQESDGHTPLNLAVVIRHSNDVEMVALLLSRGADPLLANKKGISPMHHAAGRGSIDMIDMIFAASPAALNQGGGKDGTTPLGLMVGMVLMSPRDRERIMRHLLSLGATDKDVPNKGENALVRAAGHGYESMVRMLLDAAAGRRAGKFWGTEALSRAVVVAAGEGLAKTVRMLVTAEGEGRQQHWARVRASDMPVLFSAASSGSVPTVAVLLAAGADELARDKDGHRASDYAGMTLPAGGVAADSKTSAVKRTLQRAPAFRARSWAWSTAAVPAQGGGAGTAARGSRESSPTPAVGVRLFRPRDPRFFTTRFNRYSRKL